jgi:hypothetical protein
MGNGFAIPLAFFVHANKTIKDYEYFFLKVVEVCNNKFGATMALGDYEKAFRSAVEHVLKIPYWGDFFHFMQANVHWLNTNGAKQIVEVAVPYLRQLFHAQTYSEFNHLLVLFRNEMTITCAPYALYFTKQWEQNVPPEVWASYVRPKGTTSGDNHLEGTCVLFNNLHYKHGITRSSLRHLQTCN